MTDEMPPIDELLARIEAGKLDELGPEDVARLETWLDHDAEALEQLGGMTPPSEPWLSAVDAGPTRAEWDETWAGISSTTSDRHGHLRRRSGVLSGLAVAACLALAALLNINLPAPTDSAAWPVEWAQSVEVEVEIREGGTPMVFTVGHEDPVSLIWVVDTAG